ncbi:hypothetical protein M9H77_08292 [Catharanthus roseus]|uniref:Uncharacterized protein n=1 Tax=Catharanthus roseus TaxID=4058 RepID=A0ACC0BXK7_CATRO|nr:hypothetical protein M9H77_08292 [Catharanthus roseus]
MHRSGAPNRRVSGLHCTWLVPRTRSSSDDVDERGIDRGGCGPIGLCGYCIMLYGGVRPPSGESGGARHRGWFQGRPGRKHYRTHTHVDSLSVRAHVFPYHVFFSDYFWIKSPWKGIDLSYNLVPRGTQMPYSAAVDLVAGLGASHNQSKSPIVV